MNFRLLLHQCHCLSTTLKAPMNLDTSLFHFLASRVNVACASLHQVEKKLIHFQIDFSFYSDFCSMELRTLIMMIHSGKVNRDHSSLNQCSLSRLRKSCRSLEKIDQDYTRARGDLTEPFIMLIS